MADTVEIPLFPLHPVLFPGGRLPLQIFEPRYTDMIGTCMRDGKAFGVVLIRRGSDARLISEMPQPEIFDVGTEAHVVDFNLLANGRLGIVVRGGRKFRVRSTREQDDHLLIGEVEYLAEEPVLPIDSGHQELVDILRELIKHPMIEKLGLEIDFSDARSVGWRLAELLPDAWLRRQCM